MSLILLAGISKPVDLRSPIYNGSNFTWAEATRNGERLPQNTRFEDVFIPASSITGNIVKIARELDKIRERFGNQPITVTSWLRPPDINRAVGGVSNSHHLLGWGVDIQIRGFAPPEVADILAKDWMGGLGDNPAYTHLDLRHLRGGKRARWDYGGA